ncbi:MAG: hypothetical protein LBK55_08890 [Azoarcus sp.]|jgi:hypothetical protein|nr:hypothetical protein [Azoarcus sp.]
MHLFTSLYLSAGASVHETENLGDSLQPRFSSKEKRHRFALLPVLALSVFLAGCAGNPLRSYNKELGNTISMVNSGNVKGALAQLEADNDSILSSRSKEDAEGTGKEKTQADSIFGKDILYFFEKGELLRLDNEYERSRDTWLQADEVVRIWEDEYRVNPGKVVGEIGAYLVSDRVRRYDGQDYEKVFLSTKLMLDHVMLGNDEHARIEMKKTFEREKLIESFREQEYERIREEGNKRSISFSIDDLAKNGYPVDKLDSSDVRALKNGYQNAFAHYLSGYFFEMKGEYSLAAPGYRNALELRPDSRLIREKTGKLGGKPGPGKADVLFVVESGFAPALRSITIPLPIPFNKEVIVTPLSFPVITADARAFVPPSLNVGGRVLPVETLVNVDALARRQLKDMLPGIIGRTAVRAAVKSVLQYQAKKKGNALAGLGATVATVATEQADERSWRTLPARLSVARAILPTGEQEIEFRTHNGTYRGKIKVEDTMTIVPIRLSGNFVYVGQRDAQGTLTAAPEIEEEETEEAEEEIAQESKATAKPRRVHGPRKQGVRPRVFH